MTWFALVRFKPTFPARRDRRFAERRSPYGWLFTSLAARYSPYLIRQEADLKVFFEDENVPLPPHLDYDLIEGLSSEVRERLFAVRPSSVVRPMYTVTAELFAECFEGRGEENGGNDSHKSYRIDWLFKTIDSCCDVNNNIDLKKRLLPVQLRRNISH